MKFYHPISIYISDKEIKKNKIGRDTKIEFKGVLKLISIKKEDFERLVKANLINFSKANKNYAIVNAKKKSKRKKYFVVESKKILNFLGVSR